jgi:O-antigen/teichoic acid export membrane protein
MTIELTVGSEYADVVHTIVLLTFGYTWSFFGICCVPSIYALHKLQSQLLISIGCSLLFYIVTLLSIERLGIEGAALGQLACYASGIAAYAIVVFTAVRRLQHDNRMFVS